MGEARRVTTIVAWVLLVWTVLLGLWAMQPLTDQVPTGKIDGVATLVPVECARPIDADAGPDSLPELEPPQRFGREPCVEQHSDNRWMLLVNVVLIAAIAIGLIAVRLQLRRSPKATDSGQASAAATP